MSDLKEHFNREAEAFDKQVLKNIPKYPEMITALINAIPDKKENPKILDLGCGTGNITLKVLEKFPNSQITCLDLSENMIKIAKNKLEQYESIEYIIGDFTKTEITEKYDAIISSLALHHIPNDKEKQEMYHAIYEALNESGVFYNADVIQGNSQYNEELNNNVAAREMLDNGSTQEEISELNGKRDANDIPTTIYNHIKMLENVGFKEIDIIWKYYANVVYGGTRKE